MKESTLKIEKVNDEHYEIIRREDSRLMGAVVYSFDRGAWYNQPVGVSPKKLNYDDITGKDTSNGLKIRIKRNKTTNVDVPVFCEIDGDRAWIHLGSELKVRVIPAMMPPGCYSVIKQFPPPVEVECWVDFDRAIEFANNPYSLS